MIIHLQSKKQKVEAALTALSPDPPLPTDKLAIIDTSAGLAHTRPIIVIKGHLNLEQKTFLEYKKAEEVSNCQ